MNDNISTMVNLHRTEVISRQFLEDETASLEQELHEGRIQTNKQKSQLAQQELVRLKKELEQLEVKTDFSFAAKENQRAREIARELAHTGLTTYEIPGFGLMFENLDDVIRISQTAKTKEIKLIHELTANVSARLLKLIELYLKKDSDESITDKAFELLEGVQLTENGPVLKVYIDDFCCDSDKPPRYRIDEIQLSKDNKVLTVTTDHENLNTLDLMVNNMSEGSYTSFNVIDQNSGPRRHSEQPYVLKIENDNNCDNKSIPLTEYTKGQLPDQYKTPDLLKQEFEEVQKNTRVIDSNQLTGLDPIEILARVQNKLTWIQP